MTEQIKVGAFVLFGAVVLAVVITILGKVQLKSGYSFDIIFNDISGLADNSPIKIAGVKVGKVTGFEITGGGKAKVRVWLEQKYKVHQGCDARVVSTGLIGTKYLQMNTGDEDKPFIKSGETIEGISSVSVEEILESLKPSAGEKPLGDSIREVIDNMRSITRKIDVGIGNEGDVKSIVQDIKKTAENIRKFTDAIGDQGGDFASTLKKLPELIDDAKAAFKSIDEMTDKLSSSKGTLGTLINDEEVAGDVKSAVTNLKDVTNSAKKVLDRMTAIKTYWDYNIRYNTGDHKMRNDLGIKIVPRKNKFYYLGVSNIREKNGRDYDVSQSTGQKIVSANAYLGKIFGQVTVYGGLIKSAGGFGVSFEPLKSVSLDSQAYRFDRKVNGDTKPWVDVNARLRFTNWLYANAGVSDVLQNSDFQIGLNLVYDDEDLPYLFGLGSIAATVPK